MITDTSGKPTEELNWQQREALKMLDRVHPIRGTDLQSKRVGMGTLEMLLERAWAEHSSGPRDLSGFYIITDAGREAQKLPVKSTWPKRDKRLRVAPPRLRSSR